MKIVFAGPSIFNIDKTLIREVILAAPIQQGDIIKAINSGVTSIGIIDGYFEDRPSIWHKEIIYALDLGVNVIGASSIGALRAVECEKFGMIGVGEIYQKYKNNEYCRDDYVSVLHSPKELNYRPLTDAHVNIEATLREAYKHDKLNKKNFDKLNGISQALYFKDRTYEAILKISNLSHKTNEVLSSWISNYKIDLKLQDAISLFQKIHTMNDGTASYKIKKSQNIQMSKLINMYTD